jgi:hypothetical protein
VPSPRTDRTIQVSSLSMTDTDFHGDDADDLARLFREHDDLGADSSLWLRPLRLLLDRGKPPGEMTVLAFRLPDTGSLPFGVLTHTKRNRVVFWPVLPKDAQAVAEDGSLNVIDHLTLELPSQKTHLTAFNADGRRVHRAAADFGHNEPWRLHRFEGTGLAFWFSMLARCCVLRDQDDIVQRRVAAPLSDVERRQKEVARYASFLKIVDVPLPPIESEPTYVFCVVYYVVDASVELKLSSEMFLLTDVDSQITGWPDGTEFLIKPFRLSFRQVEFVIATACPPGQLRGDVILGLPRNRRKSREQ